MPVTIVGLNFTEVEEEYPAIFGYIAAGSIPLNPPDNVVVVGAKISNLNLNGTIFTNVGDQMYVTTQVPIANKTYVGNVTAVLKPVGFSYGGLSDTGVYIPINQAERYFGTDQLSQITVVLKNSNNDTVSKVSEAITNYFKGQVTVESSVAIINTIRSAIASTDVVVVGIAAVSLLVAGVSIMNIMIVSTIERTREIGILKAIGYRPKQIMGMFLSEAALTGVVGGITGLMLGYVLSFLMGGELAGSTISFGRGGPGGGGGAAIVPVFSTGLIVFALTFPVLLATAAGLYPAWRASRLNPVVALKYE